MSGGTHPIRLVVTDDLRRSRVTVFFRLFLTIPHFFWLSVWSVGVVFALVAAWFAALVLGRTPRPLHHFLAGYIRYSTHVSAYLLLAANPFPGFLGHAGSYPVDLEIDEAGRQSRWMTGFRGLLVVPALLLTFAVAGSVGPAQAGFIFASGVVAFVAFLAWFAALARGRMPRGFRDLVAYALGYAAQTYGYLFLVTDRYPNSDPERLVSSGLPPHPVRLTVEDDERRSRLTVVFRLLLALPHFVWFTLWTIVASAAGIANWLATLAVGRSPHALHRFLAAYVRYRTHLYAFVGLIGNPFPGFAGAVGSYPIDLELDGPEPQNRWITGFRLLLGFPAFLVAASLETVLVVVAVLAWFAALATGRMPHGLRNLGAYILRYSAQTYAYGLVLTERYPYCSPSPVEPPERIPEAVEA